MVESGDGDLCVGGRAGGVDDADEGERVLQHDRDDGGQLQTVGLEHELQQVPESEGAEGLLVFSEFV